MMRHFALYALALALMSCGEAPVDTQLASTFVIPPGCPMLGIAQPLQAKLLISGVNSELKPFDPCPLKVTLSPQGEYLTTGLCPSVPVGMDRVLTLQWYVVAPKTQKQIVIAEATGSAGLKTAMNKTLQIDFDPSKAPSLKPKTKAAPTETAAEKDRFNCDRSGQFGPDDTPCDSLKPVTQTPGADKDNCSNLEELCKDTLFKATDDTDCN